MDEQNLKTMVNKALDEYLELQEPGKVLELAGWRLIWIAENRLQITHPSGSVSVWELTDTI